MLHVTCFCWFVWWLPQTGPIRTAGFPPAIFLFIFFKYCSLNLAKYLTHTVIIPSLLLFTSYILLCIFTTLQPILCLYGSQNQSLFVSTAVFPLPFIWRGGSSAKKKGTNYLSNLFNNMHSFYFCSVLLSWRVTLLCTGVPAEGVASSCFTHKHRVKKWRHVDWE